MIIGAMKCGTTTLAAQLGAQSGIFMTTPKEPNFFSDDENYRKGLKWYASLFDSALPGDIQGEASTHYTKLPRYPQTVARIKQAGLHPRIIYMIRNPLSRLVSHYLHAVSENWTNDPLDIAIKRLPELVDYGLFGRQITPFVDAFGTENILLTSLERLKREPGAELARIGRHIGHSGPVHWVDDLAEQNVSAERVRKLPFHGLLVDNPVATAARRLLVPKGIRTRVRESRRVSQRPALNQQDKADLKTQYLCDLATLESFFENDQSIFAIRDAMMNNS